MLGVHIFPDVLFSFSLGDLSHFALVEDFQVRFEHLSSLMCCLFLDFLRMVLLFQLFLVFLLGDDFLSSQEHLALVRLSELFYSFFANFNATFLLLDLVFLLDLGLSLTVLPLLFLIVVDLFGKRLSLIELRFQKLNLGARCHTCFS